MRYTRITKRRDQLSGKPCIRGLWIPVGLIAKMSRAGRTDDELLDWYPDLEAEDLVEARAYAEDHPTVLKR